MSDEPQNTESNEPAAPKKPLTFKLKPATAKPVESASAPSSEKVAEKVDAPAPAPKQESKGPDIPPVVKVTIPKAPASISKPLPPEPDLSPDRPKAPLPDPAKVVKLPQLPKRPVPFPRENADEPAATAAPAEAEKTEAPAPQPEPESAPAPAAEAPKVAETKPEDGAPAKPKLVAPKPVLVKPGAKPIARPAVGAGAPVKPLVTPRAPVAAATKAPTAAKSQTSDSDITFDEPSGKPSMAALAIDAVAAAASLAFFTLAFLRLQPFL
jgi:hypothetical protein